ncbi:hypothetical protein C3L33_17140, partial [Rhododendron williamsianum]
MMLFTTVRDSLGLTYDVSFELNLFDRLKLGWYVISVTSTPGKVYKAVDACKNVLRGKTDPVMRHEAESKSNAYWLGLLAHLQAASVPRKDITCIKDLNSLYEAATVKDLYLAYDQLKIDESSLYSCIGVAGAQAGEEIAGNEDLPSSVIGAERDIDQYNRCSAVVHIALEMVVGCAMAMVLCHNDQSSMEGL